MKRKLLLLSFILILVLAAFSNASAQDAPYYFEVNKEVVHVYWNPDGTMSVDYTWYFNNLPGSHPIDFVDVGMPNYNFNTSTIVAESDGMDLMVTTQDYQGSGSGFAVVMGSRTIQPGDKGILHVFVPNISSVLYNDANDANYASAVFAPTWFGQEFVSGNTDFTMTFHLPPNMNPEEPRWHEAPSDFPETPQAAYDSENRVTYTWYAPAATAYNYYSFGASFPRIYVPAEAIYTPPPEPLFNIDEDTIFSLLCGGFFFFIFFISPAIAAITGRRRKMQYLPPRVAIEGHGIKRGLTAVEAAILMEQPLDKVMTMILFSVIKKGAAQVETRDPLKLSVAAEQPATLHPYEKDFIKAFAVDEKRSRVLQDMTVALIKSVSEKMRGFSRKETVEYYKSITEKAWAQVEAAGTPEVKSQKMDESLEWTMLDKDYDDRARRVYNGPVYVPTWWGRYDPSYRRISTPTTVSGPTISSTPRPSSSGQALPGADFAASMVTGVQTFSQKVIGNVQSFTERVTGATNPLPKSSSSGGRSGGGGRSCACACACAGCACACAGGGR